MQDIEYYDKIKRSINSHGWGELPAWSEIDAARQETLSAIMQRLDMAQSLAGDLSAPTGNQAARAPDNGAMKLYLMLTCVNMLGHGDQNTVSMDFPTWLAANQASAAAPLDTAQSNGKAKAGTVSVGVTESVAAAYADYQSQVGSKSNFIHVFTKNMDHDMQQWIGNNCWIYADEPMEDWSDLHLVERGYSNSGTPELQRLTNSRKRWDALTMQARMIEIADFCESIHNQFAVGITPLPLDGKQDPVPKMMRAIGTAVADGHLNYLSDTAYRKLDPSGADTTMIHDIECILKDSELYMRSTDVEGKDIQSWRNQLQIWSPRHVGKSRAITLPDMPRALVLPDELLVDHLNNWIDNALSGFILNN